MNNDTLRDFLDLARREMPDVPGDVWPRLARLAEKYYGQCWLYVNAPPRKRINLDEVAAGAAHMTSAAQAVKLKISVRRVQQLRKLLREAS